MLATRVMTKPTFLRKMSCSSNYRPDIGGWLYRPNLSIYTCLRVRNDMNSWLHMARCRLNIGYILNNVTHSSKKCLVISNGYAKKSKKALSEEAGEEMPFQKVANLDIVIKQIEQTFGKGTVMKLDASPKQLGPEDVISTGSLSLDLALGIGGLPKGRIVEIFGPESSGKTTLALHCIASSQAIGGQCVFVDAEHALDVNWARKLGVRTESLLVAQPDSGEQALEIIDTLVQTGQIDVIVLDSVAALVPRIELEGEMGALQIGAQARLMSQAMRKLVGSLKKTNTLLIFLNQIRMKIGVMFGNPETTAGGNALKYYASVRLDIRRTGSVKKGDVIVANQIRVKVAKNKLAPPFRQAEFDVEFGRGISKEGELVDLGIKTGVLEKTGSWYSIASTNTQLGQGREKVKTYLVDNPDESNRLEKLIREKVSNEEEGTGGLVVALSPDGETFIAKEEELEPLDP